MTRGRWYIILALLILALAAGLVEYNLNRGPGGPSPTRQAIRLY